jgi:hypothetical protein
MLAALVDLNLSVFAPKEIVTKKITPRKTAPKSGTGRRAAT